MIEHRRTGHNRRYQEERSRAHADNEASERFQNWSPDAGLNFLMSSVDVREAKRRCEQLEPLPARSMLDG
jgi:hypothetical protein